MNRAHSPCKDDVLPAELIPQCLAGMAGIEPATLRLTGGRSTAELHAKSGDESGWISNHIRVATATFCQLNQSPLYGPCMAGLLVDLPLPLTPSRWEGEESHGFSAYLQRRKRRSTASCPRRNGRFYRFLPSSGGRFYRFFPSSGGRFHRFFPSSGGRFYPLPYLLRREVLPVLSLPQKGGGLGRGLQKTGADGESRPHNLLLTR